MHRRDIQKSREDAVKVNQNEENNGTTHAGVDGPLVLSVETVDDDEVSGSSRFCAEGAPCHTCIGHSSDSLSTASSSSSSSSPSPSPSSSSSKAAAFTSWSRCEKSNECNVDRKGENGHDIISNLLMQNEEGEQCKVAQSMEVQSTKKIDVVGATNHSSATNNQQHELMSLKQLYDQILRTAHETTTRTIPTAASTMDIQIKDKWESCSKFAKEARGPRFLLLSAGAFASALGASCIRWVLSETGEVLLLFFVVDEGTGISGGVHHGDIELSRHDLENMGVDPDFIADAPCFEGNDNKMRQILLHMARNVHRSALTLSPHLRVTTLVLLFLSTASFLLGVVLTKRELQKFFDVVIYQGLYREILHQTLYEGVWCETIHPVLEISRTLGKNFWMHLRQDVSGEVERWMDFILKFLVHVNRVYLTSSRGFSETLPQLTTVSSNPSESSRSKLNMQQKLQHIINISKVTQTNLQTKLVQTTQRVISCTDQLVLDDLLRKCHQRGLEMMGGVIGALVLYGVPDEIFPSTPPLPSSKLLEYSSSPSVELSSKVIEIQGTGSKSSNERNNDVIYDQNKGMKRTRQRIVKSIDPALESILFQPGGVWAAMPMGGELREYLKRLVVAGNVSLFGDQKNLLKVQSITECDCDAASRDGCVSGEGKGEPVEMPYSETIGEVLTSTLRDIIEPNVPSPFPPPISGADKQQAPSGVNKMDSNLSCQNARPPTPISPQTPFPHVEKILDRMTVASVLLFLFHIRSSQITRKAWWSAVQFSISTGILGVALGTGLASRTLGSEYVKSAISRNPVLKMICVRVWESLPISGYCRNLSELSCSVEDTLKRWFLKMKEELKEKKHLQMLLAILIFYGVRRLPRLSAGKGGYISTVGGRYTAGRSRRDVRKIRYGD